MFQSSPGWLQRWWTLTARWRIPYQQHRVLWIEQGWLGISKEAVEVHDSLLGVLLDPSPLPLTLAELKSLHPGAFTPESMAAVASVSAELPINFSLSWNQEFEVNSLLNWQGGQQTWSRCEEWGEKWEKESRSQNQKWKCKKIHFCPGTWGNWRAEK